MEAKIRGKSHNLYGPVVSDVNSVGKRSMEWDLNDWKWDGDMFTALKLNPVPSDCRSRQFFPVGSEIPVNVGISNGLSLRSDEVVLGNDRGMRELEKRRRDVVLEEEEMDKEDGSLILKLGGHVYPITEGEMEKWEGKSGKKIKAGGPFANHAVCQVEDCRADLSNAKDYHRRHKVCDVHSKATRALVRNVMQRFCQQCSRFHVLQEFDEGKRSCRRRLAGHNRRRRKTHPENVAAGTSSNDEGGSNYLLISLLRILSNIHSNSSDQPKDQDLLSHLLRNLANRAGTVDEKNVTELLPGSQDLKIETTKDPGSNEQNGAALSSEERQKTMLTDDAQGTDVQNQSAIGSGLLLPTRVENSGNAVDTTAGRTKLNDFDLNSAYEESRDCMEDLQIANAPKNEVSVPPHHEYQEPCKSSPPQTSGNSASTSSLSPSSSSGEAQSRTDRIVFKLFGKDPNDFPHVLRNQILDWLSHSPVDIESYIRPGCIVLTIYMQMDKSIWEELCCDMSSNLRRLLSLSTDSFWRTGWIYTRVRNRVAFIYNGQVVVDTSLPYDSHRSCKISSIKPLAASLSEGVRFSVKGLNLSQSTARLLCALQGKYLVQENWAEMVERPDAYIGHSEIQSLSFACAIPNVIGRGFIEVEDHGLSSSFFPFIVAEKDVCLEICTLESVIEFAEEVDANHGDRKALEARNQALHFMHEIGWLLHRSQLKLRSGETGFHHDLFHFERFRWLLEFSIDREWCAVVKKLLAILFNGIIDVGQYKSAELGLFEIGLLHRAVRQNCKPMVEFLLRYRPDGLVEKIGAEQKQKQGNHESGYLFRPDAAGPGGVTPLHIAANKDGSENVLDALTDDPGLVGIGAWRTIRDSTGLTPINYASLRGYNSYIDLVQKKINRSQSGHVVVDIPANRYTHLPVVQVASFQTEVVAERLHQGNCRQCEQKLVYGNTKTSLAMYRPAMLSMVAIAAVCVCVALLFKSSPEVVYVFRPFRWEQLEYGSM